MKRRLLPLQGVNILMVYKGEINTAPPKDDVYHSMAAGRGVPQSHTIGSVPKKAILTVTITAAPKTANTINVCLGRSCLLPLIYGRALVDVWHMKCITQGFELHVEQIVSFRQERAMDIN